MPGCSLLPFPRELRVALAAVLSLSLAAGPVLAEVPAGVRAYRAPTFTTATLALDERVEVAPCDRVDCVRRRLGSGSTVRLSGEFGSFTGRVAHWGPDSLAGFSADPVRGGTAPVATVAWPDVERVDRQVDNTWRGAILGGLIGGLLVTPFAISATAPTKRLTSYDSNEQADAGPIVAAATVGALAAAFLGAAIGSAANRWKPVYTRP